MTIKRRGVVEERAEWRALLRGDCSRRSVRVEVGVCSTDRYFVPPNLVKTLLVVLPAAVDAVNSAGKVGSDSAFE